MRRRMKKRLYWFADTKNENVHKFASLIQRSRLSVNYDLAPRHNKRLFSLLKSTSFGCSACGIEQLRLPLVDDSPR